MSLILEALKKVERERVTPEQRGFLVLGPTAWAPARSHAGLIVGMVAAALVAGGGVYLLTRPAASPLPSVPRTEDRAVAPLPQPEAPPATTAWEPPPRSSAPRPRSAATPAPVNAGADAPAPRRVLLLNAISEQDGVPIAVVNDRVVREGDRFDGIRVLRIGATEVEVEVDGARRILRF